MRKSEFSTYLGQLVDIARERNTDAQVIIARILDGPDTEADSNRIRQFIYVLRQTNAERAKILREIEERLPLPVPDDIVILDVDDYTNLRANQPSLFKNKKPATKTRKTAIKKKVAKAKK